MAENKKEKLLDEALLAQFKIEPHLKITTSLTIAIHRQLLALSENTGIAINDMDREFIIEQLAKVQITESKRKAAIASVSDSLLIP